jgi:Xaa-Pro aminopeptidase
MSHNLIKAAEALAQRAVEDCLPMLEPGVTEKAFAEALESRMRELGAQGTWYPTIVRFTTEAEPGRTFYTARRFRPEERVRYERRLTLIDVQPIVEGHWGDYAMSFCEHEDDEASEQLVRDALALHDRMVSFMAPDRTCSEVYEYCQALLDEAGYINADRPTTNPHINIGHSIEQRPGDRIYVCAQEKTKLAGRVWTCEPHIARGEGAPTAVFERLVSFAGDSKEVFGDFPLARRRFQESSARRSCFDPDPASCGTIRGG